MRDGTDLPHRARYGRSIKAACFPWVQLSAIGACGRTVAANASPHHPPTAGRKHRTEVRHVGRGDRGTVAFHGRQGTQSRHRALTDRALISAVIASLST